MTHQSTAIDGRGIQSERLRDLRLHQHRFAEFEVFFFVPEPCTRGASEAFISAREKQRVFTVAGFRCTVCRVGEDAASRGLRAIESGKAFYIVSARSSRTTSSMAADGRRGTWTRGLRKGLK
jgi:hypothetical protein